jgi:hypothetical protein
MTPLTKKIQAAVLALAIMAPAESAFALSRHRRVTNTRTYTTTPRHRKHYSQTGGALVGAAAGAIIDRRHPLTGALIGAAVGEGVQYERNRRVRKH